jgi:ribosomal protein S15P/S13E
MAGTLQTVGRGQEILIESTAEGRSGHFFELCEKYRQIAESGEKLTEMDFKFLFYPWYKHPDYLLFEPTEIDRETESYFKSLEDKHGIFLNEHQKAWYFKKQATLREHMKQEYPSTPQEAFEEGIEGYYYSKDIANLRKIDRLTKVPYDPNAQVHTAWDLGIDDATAIWFFQVVGQEVHLIDYYENNNESLAHYVNYLNDKRTQWPNLVYGKHLFPHDVAQRELSTGTTREKTLKDLGCIPTVVEKTPISEGIHAVRMLLPRCYIDAKACSTGIKHLEAYRKDFSSKYGVFTDRPFHGSESHACDAMRYLAVGIKRVEAGHGMTAQEARELEDKYRFRYN